MAKYLATYSDTIGEIEIHGFTIMTTQEMETYEDLASSITWSFLYQMGEEEIEFTSGEDLLSRVDFREISNDEHKVLKKVFKGEFGVFITEDFLSNIADEEEEDEELEDDDNEYPRYGDDDEDDDY
jgi:hypothetical protein